MMDGIVLAGVALEVAECRPDIDNDIPRAEWAWNTIEKAIEIIKAEGVTIDTDDIDEVVRSYLNREKASS